MSLRKYFLVASIFLVGCTSTAIDPEIVKQKHNVVIDDYVRCLKHFVGMVDDGTSDPASIAFALNSACSVQYDAITKFWCDYEAQNYSQCKMMKFHRSGIDARVQSAIPAVIVHRKNNK